ncbi:MAG: DNA-directed RNA polymerase subunit beta [bacterium]|nr:DNA-directed RNA polymerase subunit beta [bacterium]
MSTQTAMRVGPAERKFFSARRDATDLPNLIEVQLDSYRWFLEKGLRELFDELNPIEDFTKKELELHFLDYYLDEAKFDEVTAKARNSTFEAPLRVKIRLVNKRTGEIKDQEVFLGDFPLMTERGTFIINGVERVIVSQLIRSPGVYFTSETSQGSTTYGAKLIPNRGAWLEFDTDSKGVISVKIDRKRTIAVSALLRAFGYSTDEEIKALFTDVDTDPDIKYIEATIAKDPSRSNAEGLKEVYKRIRPGDLATVDNAKQMIDSMFFDFDRYDFGRVGRYKLNQRFNQKLAIDRKTRVFSKEDLIHIIREIIRLNIVQDPADDIDHLGNRRVRAIGELIQNKFRIGMARLERIVRDRMSTLDIDTLTPAQLINARPVIAAVKEFFTNSQLSQFMDQTNPLSELEHKRRLSAMGPGGLSRERAGFDVRDVHPSHYGRICPIQTPEGPNIGLVGHLASYCRINEYGFLETPFRKVVQSLPANSKELVGKFIGQDILGAGGTVVLKKGHAIADADIATIRSTKVDPVIIKPYVTNEIVFLDAFEEGRSVTAPATIETDEQGYFVNEKDQVRSKGESGVRPTSVIQFVDVSPKQIISVATSLIPFLEHDDGNRALMGSNMQRQAVSTIRPQSPIVGTGIEAKAAIDSGQVVVSQAAGKVVAVDAKRIEVLQDDGNLKIYNLLNFSISNQNTSMHQHPIVEKGQQIKKGDILADGASTQKGELALGQNILIAFMGWNGGNYEDAILISQRVVENDRFSSIHIENFSVDVRDTKLGPEIVTRDIPNIGEEKLKDLDEDGIIRIGAQVSSGDILIGKITPKGETDLTAEERLLRAIFGEKARDVKDTSLYLQHGEYGKVIDVKLFSRDQGDKLPTGVIKTIQVSVAQLRKIQPGDKMAGRHGNKGVISRIVPAEDMPFLEDGTPIDIMLSPLGVANRMNLGQILETHLGWAGLKLGYKAASPAFNGVAESQIAEELTKAGLPEDGKVQLFDGQTGDSFDFKTTVGVMYMMKLHHLVDDKMHQRSIGPYSLVTQQPLGGKAQFGGQRFGEMEVWALEGYGASHTLQEMLTIKSDDVLGRSKTYEAIVKGEPIRKPNVPESFNVLVRELMALGLAVEMIGGPQAVEEEEGQMSLKAPERKRPVKKDRGEHTGRARAPEKPKEDIKQKGK